MAEGWLSAEGAIPVEFSLVFLEGAGGGLY